MRLNRLRARVIRSFTVLMIAILPLVSAELVHRSGPSRELVVVRTELEIDASPAVVWSHLHFYEEIQAAPPLLLRLGLPIPVCANGSKAAVGDIEVCVYEGGKGITKRITKRDEARLLAFEVIEQRLGFEHDIKLLGGSFELEPMGDRATRLTLSTRYQAKAYPSWMWRWLEATVIHTLHEHVATEIRRRSGGEQDDAARIALGVGAR